jgi:hypothetical protein
VSEILDFVPDKSFFDLFSAQGRWLKLEKQENLPENSLLIIFSPSFGRWNKKIPLFHTQFVKHIDHQDNKLAYREWYISKDGVEM